MAKKQPVQKTAAPPVTAPMPEAPFVRPSVVHEENAQIFKRAFWILAAFTFILMIVVTPHYGVTGDEVTQWNYGKSVWKYYASGGSDKAALGGEYDAYIEKKKLQYYGGLFDGTAAMFNAMFHPKDEFLLRHYWNMIFGFLGLLFTGLLAKSVTSKWRAALIAFVLIALTPRFWGECFNNPKDIPFATTAVIALYAIIEWLKHLDDLKWKRTVLLGLSIALALSIRIGGLLFLAYLVLFYCWQVWRLKQTAHMGKHLKHLAVALLIGYFGCCLFWPYAIEDPFSHPFEAYKVMADYPLGLRMLYGGHQVYASDIPRGYAPAMLAITLPLILLIGLAGSAVVLTLKNGRKQNPYLWMILFAAIFPVAYIVYKKSVLYDGIRHLLFVIPPIVACSAVAINWLMDRFSGKRIMQYAVVGVTLLLLVFPARFMFANHPNEYVYFNESVGGIKGASGKYETDYYMNSVKKCWLWLMRTEGDKIKNSPDSLLLVSNCIEPIQLSYAQAWPSRLRTGYSRFYEQNQQNWDYAIYFGRFLDREQLKHGYFPGKKAVFIVKADGVPLCAVLKNDQARDGYKGYAASQTQDYPTAIFHLKRAATSYPEDMELWQDLAIAYAQSNQPDSAQWAMDKALAISPINQNTASIAGQIADVRKDYIKEAAIFSKLTEEYPDNGEWWLYLAVAQAKGGNLAAAKSSAQQGVDEFQRQLDEADAKGEDNPQAQQGLQQAMGLMQQLNQAH